MDKTLDYDSLLSIDSQEIDQWVPCSMPNYEPGRVNLFYGQGTLRLVANFDASLLYPELVESP